jgi:type IV secretion system protein VirD4
MTAYAGFGARLQLYVQSVAQLYEAFPHGQHQTALSNTSLVAFATQDLDTARYLSERAGKETIWVEGSSTQRGWSRQSGKQGNDSYSTSGSSTTDFKQQARELSTPDEILRLDRRIALTFCPGMAPLWTYLIRYYEGAFGPPGLLKRAAAALNTFVLAAILLLFTTLLAVFMTRTWMQEERKHSWTNPPVNVELFSSP